MSINNDVFRILATKNNLPALSAGQKVTGLAPGQIGFFDANTNLSFVDGTSIRDFYLAVGVDPNSTGTTVDIKKSSGNSIQKRNIKNYSFRPYTPGQGMQIVLSDYTAECETEYGIKLEFRNEEIYRIQGFNQFIKTYSLVTSCCDECSPTCPSGDANEITKQLKFQINNDVLKLATAKAIARQDIDLETVGTSVDYTTGEVVLDADLNAIMAYNATKTSAEDFIYTDLQITTNPTAINNFCSVNLKYFYPRETVVIASKIEGFKKCTGAFTITQEAVFEEGAGYDLKQMEYEDKGWTDSPYRTSGILGVAYNNTTPYIVDSNTKYDVFSFGYEEVSEGGWQRHNSNEATIVAVPSADAATATSVATIMDTITNFVSLSPLTDDVAARIIPDTTIEKTTDKGYALDGIA